MNGCILPMNSKTAIMTIDKQNALGKLFHELTPEKQLQIMKFVSELKPSLEKGFRQYFYKNRNYNPSKLPEELKDFLKEIDKRFTYCFVPNFRTEFAILRIKKNGEVA